MRFFKIATQGTRMTLYRDTIDVVEPLEPGEYTDDPQKRRKYEQMLEEERRLMITDEMMQARGFSPQYRVDVRWTGQPQWLESHPHAPNGAVEGTYEIRVSFEVVDPALVDTLVYEVLGKSTRTI